MDAEEKLYDLLIAKVDGFGRELGRARDGIYRRLDGVENQVRIANGKTAAHAQAIEALQKQMSATDSTSKVQSNNHHTGLTLVLLKWGEQKWFWWVFGLIIASAGGHAVADWGTLIIKMFAPK